MIEDYCKKNHSRVSRHAKALYVHVPFCVNKCRYCDFYSQVGDETLKRRYVTAAVRELKLRGAVVMLTNPVGSIFVGGGTPTSLGAGLLDELLCELQHLADSGTEFTVEVNPGTIDAKIAKILVKNGVNRVSLGAQAFNPGLLKILGRIHTPQQTHEALRILRNGGIENISLDLMYGIPNQSRAMWVSDIDEALDAGVGHLSCYALSFEKNTPLWDDLKAHRVAEINDGLQRKMYYDAIRRAGGDGLEQYEISNFARPGFQCAHNMTYWSNEGYLGIGPAAASYINGTRSVNNPDTRDYLERLEQGEYPQQKSERLTGRAEMGETLMLGLRLVGGVETYAFVERFGITPIDAFPRSFGKYLKAGAVLKTDTHIRLAPEWFFTSDTVLADIIAEV